jgi:hypothetical protein
VEEASQALAPGYEAWEKHGWMQGKAEAALRGDMPVRPALGRLSSSAQRCGSLLRPPYSSTSSSARRLFPAEVEGCDGGVDPIALQRRWARVCGAKWTGVSVCEISLLCVQ